MLEQIHPAVVPVSDDLLIDAFRGDIHHRELVRALAGSDIPFGDRVNVPFYVSPETGREFSVFAGIDFNQENSDTDYKSGNQAHIETTFIQHLPMFGGMAGFGATGTWYQQITGDSGSGATHGDFKAKTVAAGPVLAYSTKAGGTDIVAELKWLHELDTKRRAEGDTIFLKIVAMF